MRLVFSRSGFRIYVNEQEYKTLTHDGTVHSAYVNITPEGVVVGDERTFSNGKRVNFIKQNKSSTAEPLQKLLMTVGKTL